MASITITNPEIDGVWSSVPDPLNPGNVIFVVTGGYSTSEAAIHKAPGGGPSPVQCQVAYCSDGSIPNDVASIVLDSTDGTWTGTFRNAAGTGLSQATNPAILLAQLLGSGNLLGTTALDVAFPTSSS